MTFLRKRVGFHYYTGISTDLWSSDYDKRKVFASEEEAESERASGNFVGIVTDIYQQS
tara:strand:- start:3896 stop:4069 length:174 start_codon:yes stop_codon:yes gene_type:complete